MIDSARIKDYDTDVERLLTNKPGILNADSNSHIEFKSWKDIYGQKALWAWICGIIIKIFKLPVIDISEKWYHKILLYTTTGENDNDITLYEFIFPHHLIVNDVNIQPITQANYIKLNFIVK